MMNKRDKMNADYAKVANRLGKTTGASKGSPPPSKGKISLKGTNPLKKKATVTWKKSF
jgi:hypothetical protein